MDKPSQDDNSGNTGNGNNGSSSGGDNSNHNSGNTGNLAGSTTGGSHAGTENTNSGAVSNPITPSENTGNPSDSTIPSIQPEPEHKEDKDNDNTNPQDTITETKEDGTVVETTVQTTNNGNQIKTVKETMTDGSVTETKTVTTKENDMILIVTKETNQQGTKKKAVISTGKQGILTIPNQLLEMLTKEEAIQEYQIEISASTIEAGKKLSKNTVVTIQIPVAGNVFPEDILLTKDSIQAAKDIGKGLKIIVMIEKNNGITGNEIERDKYTVTIPAKQLSKIDPKMKTVSVAMNLYNQKDKLSRPDIKNGLKTALENSGSILKNTCILSTEINSVFDQVGIVIQADVTKTSNVKPGNTIYLYKYNAKTGKLEEMANSKQAVAFDGTVSLEGYSGIDYIISAKKLTGTSVVTMKEGVRFKTGKGSIKKGNKLSTILTLPDTISIKNKFGTEKATIIYKSSNPKIVSISKKGVVSAKKVGKVTITATVRLESGQKITKKKTITIQ